MSVDKPTVEQVELDHYELGLRMTQATRLIRETRRRGNSNDSARHRPLIRLRNLIDESFSQYGLRIAKCFELWNRRMEHSTLLREDENVNGITDELAVLREDLLKSQTSDNHRSHDDWLRVGLEIADGIDSAYVDEITPQVLTALQPALMYDGHAPRDFARMLGTNNAPELPENDSPPSQKVWTCRNENVVEARLKALKIPRDLVFPYDPDEEFDSILREIDNEKLWGWQVLELGLRQLRRVQDLGDRQQNGNADDQLVTINQVARLVKRSPKTLANRYRKSWPDPAEAPRGSRPAKWIYTDLLPTLTEQFEPTKFPDRCPD